MEQLRRVGQLWEKLLFISGGTLNLAKCFSTLQYWQWDKKGRPSLIPMLPSDPPLILTSGQNPAQHIIKQNSNSTGLKGLGVYLNFDGTFATHAAEMRNKFDTIARRLQKSGMSPFLSMIYYKTFYLPAV